MKSTGVKSTGSGSLPGTVVVPVLLEVPYGVHRNLKSKAALKGKPLRRYMLEILAKEGR